MSATWHYIGINVTFKYRLCKWKSNIIPFSPCNNSLVQRQKNITMTTTDHRIDKQTSCARFIKIH